MWKQSKTLKTGQNHVHSKTLIKRPTQAEGQAPAHPHAEQQKSIFSRPSFVTTFDVLV